MCTNIPIRLAIGGWFVSLLLATGLAAEPVDNHGGFTDVTGLAGKSFQPERIGHQWWLVTPDGHGIFSRAVSTVDVAD